VKPETLPLNFRKIPPRGIVDSKSRFSSNDVLKGILVRHAGGVDGVSAIYARGVETARIAKPRGTSQSKKTQKN
jgi:hypothetical protein